MPVWPGSCFRSVPFLSSTMSRLLLAMLATNKRPRSASRAMWSRRPSGPLSWMVWMRSRWGCSPAAAPRLHSRTVSAHAASILADVSFPFPCCLMVLSNSQMRMLVPGAGRAPRYQTSHRRRIKDRLGRRSDQDALELSLGLEFIKVALRVGLRPQPHLAGVLVRLVRDLPHLLAVQITFHLVALHLNLELVPFTGGH